MNTNRATSLSQVNSMMSKAIGLNTCHIGIFKGTKPNLNAICDGANAGPTALVTWPNAVSALGLTQANFLGCIVLPAMTPVVNPTARTATFPLSGVATNLTVLADGTPTYFVIRQLPTAQSNNWAGFSAAGTPVMVIMGTVGVEGSDAELQFTGTGNMKTGEVYRFLDLTFQL